MKLKDLLGDKWPRRLSVSDAYSIGGPAQGFNRAYDLFCNLEIDLSELIDEGKLRIALLEDLKLNQVLNSRGIAKTAEAIKTGDIWKEIKE